MSDIKFSICIPNYNYEDFIVDTIQSVLDQTYQNFEIIVADNASIDNSVEAIKAIGDPRIRLFVNEYNVGFAPNLDKAAQHAEGDYMILLSSDDRMKPNALEYYANLIDKHPSTNRHLVLCASTDIIDEHNTITGGRHAMNGQLINGLKKMDKYTEDTDKVFDGHDVLKCVMNGSLIAIGRFVSTCYPKSLYKQVEGYSSIMTIMPDAHFSHKLMWENPTVIFTEEKLFQYRVHSNNNYAAIFKHVKLLTDGYNLTQMYSDPALKAIGSSKEQLQRNFVRHNLAKLQAGVLDGRNLYLFRAHAYLWSAYPNIMIKRKYAWLFPITCVFMPLFYIAAKLRGK